MSRGHAFTIAQSLIIRMEIPTTHDNSVDGYNNICLWRPSRLYNVETMYAHLCSSGIEDKPVEDVEWQSDKTRMIWKEIEVGNITMMYT